MHALIQNFDSCNLMPESSAVLSCPIVSQYISEIVEIICAQPV
jgi:hypothetical protein